MSRPAITDSIWFWLCVFLTGALLTLVLLENKFGARQALIERQYQGRQRAAQSQAGQEPTTPMSTPGKTQITLKPFYATFALLLCLAWGLMLWSHYLGPRRPRKTTDERIP